jgi:hypothetical protein
MSRLLVSVVALGAGACTASRTIFRPLNLQEIARINEDARDREVSIVVAGASPAAPEATSPAAPPPASTYRRGAEFVLDAHEARWVDPDSGQKVAAPEAALRILRFPNSSAPRATWALKWAGVGALGGAGTGLLLGLLVRASEFCVIQSPCTLKDPDYLKYTLVGGAAGLLLGAFVGAVDREGDYSTVSFSLPPRSTSGLVVRIDARDPAFTDFVAFAADNVESARAAASADPEWREARFVAWDDLAKALAEVTSRQRRNDYPDAKAAELLRTLLQSAPGTAWALTWNGGLARTRRDRAFARAALERFLANPQEYERSRPGDPGEDLVDPRNHGR